jgi:hypothetical protein
MPPTNRVKEGGVFMLKKNSKGYFFAELQPFAWSNEVVLF